MGPRAEEGRGKTAISLGEVQTTFDPGISEWGNPMRVMPHHLRVNI